MVQLVPGPMAQRGLAQPRPHMQKHASHASLVNPCWRCHKLSNA